MVRNDLSLDRIGIHQCRFRWIGICLSYKNVLYKIFGGQFPSHGQIKGPNPEKCQKIQFTWTFHQSNKSSSKLGRKTILRPHHTFSNSEQMFSSITPLRLRCRPSRCTNLILIRSPKTGQIIIYFLIRNPNFKFHFGMFIYFLSEIRIGSPQTLLISLSVSEIRIPFLPK